MGLSDSKRKLVIIASAIIVVVILLLSYPTTRGVNGPPGTSASIGTHRTYTTGFPLTENPISESGNWMNGETVGRHWANIRTTPGLAFGTESGALKYNDSTALLTGVWAPNQTAQATVYTVNQDEKIFEEVELRLRSSLSADRATGYEINFRCLKTANAYAQIVRWDGPLGKFTYLRAQTGSAFGVANGDVVKATIIGNLIRAYINSVEVLQARDNTYTSGSPGMGFYLQGAGGMNTNYGFTSFTAYDEPMPASYRD